MDKTTVDSMKLLMQKNTKRINSVVSEEMKLLMMKAQQELEMNESKFIRLSIAEKLERMFNK